MMWSTMCNPTDSTRSYGCRFGFYVAMIAMLLYASHLQIQSQVLIYTGTNEVTQALRFSAIMIMEENEYQAEQSEEQREEEIAARYHHASHYYRERAKQEGKEEERSRTRSEYYDYLTKIDAEYENMTYHIVLSDDQVRLELLQNISQEEDEINALHQEEMEIEDSPCQSWFVFENVCTMFRIIPDRRLVASQKANEVQTLVQERAKLNEVEQEEYIYEIVTAILQGYVSKYNRTAHELLQQSMEWDMKMRHDLQMAQEEREIAHEYDIAVQSLQEHVQQELLWLESNKLKANTLFHNATYHIQMGRSYRQYSTMLGFIVLVFFVTCWIKRILWTAFTLIVAQHELDPINPPTRDDIYTIVWHMSYGIQHMLIFLVTCGLTLDVATYDQHIIRTILFFAFSAALMQTTLLHTLPHVAYGLFVPQQLHHPLCWRAFRLVGIQFLVRTLLYTMSFALELCIIWLAARNLIFTKEHVAFYRNSAFVLLFFVTVTLHNIILEQRRWNTYNIDRLDDEATFLLNSDDDGTNNYSNDDTDNISIATSVDSARIEICSNASHDVSTNPTESMPFAVLRGLAQTNTTSRSISSTFLHFNSTTSPNRLNVQFEFIKLLVLVDTLFVTYSFMMLHHDGSTSTMMIVLITVLMSIGVAIAAYLRSMYDHHYQAQCSNDSSFSKGTNLYNDKRLSISKSFQTYNSIDV